MADTDTSLPVDSGSPASTADTSSASVSTSDTGASSDSRAIAAQLLSETDATPAAPQATDPAQSSQAPAAATSGEDDEAEYQRLLASGSMPVDRHKAVLTNARNKTRAEVEAEFKAKYGWADTYDRQRADQALGLMQALDKNPEHALRALAAAMGISFAPPAAPPEPEGPPPPDVRLDDGSEFYSAAQLNKLHAWKDQQVAKQLADLRSRYEPLIQERELGRLREQSQQHATTTLAECRAEWPGFTGLEADIKARMVADPNLTLERAYIRAYAAKGLPALQQQHDTDRASQLHRKAAASAAPPSAPRAVTPLRDRDRTSTDLAREEFARLGA